MAKLQLTAEESQPVINVFVTEAVLKMRSQARQLGITDCTHLLCWRPLQAAGAFQTTIISAPASASSLSYTSQVYSDTITITAGGSSNFSSIRGGSSSNGTTSSSSSSGNSRIGAQPSILSRRPDSLTFESNTQSSNSSSLSQSISTGVRSEHTSSSRGGSYDTRSSNSSVILRLGVPQSPERSGGERLEASSLRHPGGDSSRVLETHQQSSNQQPGPGRETDNFYTETGSSGTLSSNIGSTGQTNALNYMLRTHINDALNCCEPVNRSLIDLNPPAVQQSRALGQAAAVPPPTALASAASLLTAPLPGPCSLHDPKLGRVGHPPSDALGPLPSAQGPTLCTVGHHPVELLSPPLPLPLPLLALPNLSFVPHGLPPVSFPDCPNQSYFY